MGEVDYDRLLDAVQMAIAPIPEEDSELARLELAHLPTCGVSEPAANDNERAWPFIPFPEGWNASC
jgi:hypothetical protein